MTTRFYLIYTIFILLLAGCADEEQRGEEPVPTPPEELVAVSFSSTIDLTTKATEEVTENLAEGALIDVHVYKQANTTAPSGSPLVTCRYKVVSGGNMEPADPGNTMYLPVGTYAFFALAINTKEKEPPALAASSSCTGELQNGLDYIYCAVNSTLHSSPEAPQNVSLSFLRLATRIDLKIDCGSGSDKATAAEAPTFALPLTNPAGTKISLGANPVITAGTQVEKNNTQVLSTGSVDKGFTASYIQLPLAGRQDIPVTITFPSITFGDLVQTDKVYTLTIPNTETGLVSGNQYNYQVNITGNDISFNNLTVTEWTGGTNGSLSDSDITEDF